jgi:hypothetical protein
MHALLCCCSHQTKKDNHAELQMMHKAYLPQIAFYHANMPTIATQYIIKAYTVAQLHYTCMSVKVYQELMHVQ